MNKTDLRYLTAAAIVIAATVAGTLWVNAAKEKEKAAKAAMQTTARQEKAKSDCAIQEAALRLFLSHDPDRSKKELRECEHLRRTVNDTSLGARLQLLEEVLDKQRWIVDFPTTHTEAERTRCEKQFEDVRRSIAEWKP